MFSQFSLSCTRYHVRTLHEQYVCTCVLYVQAASIYAKFRTLELLISISQPPIFTTSRQIHRWNWYRGMSWKEGQRVVDSWQFCNRQKWSEEVPRSVSRSIVELGILHWITMARGDHSLKRSAAAVAESKPDSKKAKTTNGKPPLANTKNAQKKVQIWRKSVVIIDKLYWV